MKVIGRELSREEIRQGLKERKDRLLRLDQVAELLGASQKTVKRLTSEGQFYGFHVRNSLKISERSVFEYMDRQDNLYVMTNDIIDGQSGQIGQADFDPKPERDKD